MKTAKKSERTKLKVFKEKKSVEAPKGFHWMEERGRYYLMKGDYGEHPGAVKEAMFNLAHHGK